jgi:hypothetical protein
LSRGDRRIIERVHESQPQFLFEQPGMFIGVVELFAFKHDLAAHRFGLHDFHRGRGLGHDDGHGNAKPRAMIAQALGMVACRRGNHAAIARFLGHQQQRIQRAAFLIGGGELKVFELQVDIRAGQVGQRLAVQGGRRNNGVADALMRGTDIGKGQKFGHGGAGPNLSGAKCTD